MKKIIENDTSLQYVLYIVFQKSIFSYSLAGSWYCDIDKRAYFSIFILKKKT